MSDMTRDRRRWHRSVTGDQCELELQLTHHVRLIDISMTGALVRIAGDSMPGPRAELRTTLGDSPFAVAVEVRRAAAEPESGRSGEDQRVGVTFIGIDAPNRRCLERFLRQPAS
jgi:hypothetical protein